MITFVVGSGGVVGLATYSAGYTDVNTQMYRQIFTNSVDPNHTRQDVVCDVGTHCL